MVSLTGALIAYFALGANLLGTALLLLFNPHSRAVRWFVPFELALMGWLATQGWALGTGAWEETEIARFLPVHFMPGLFLAFALAEGSSHSVAAPSMRGLLAPPALALVLLFFVIGPVDGPWSNLVAVGW
jgi:hypothetical protein